MQTTLRRSVPAWIRGASLLPVLPLVLALVLPLVLAVTGCTDARPNLAAGNPPPGGLSITTRTPVDFVALEAKPNPRTTVFQCKPLACAVPAFLSVGSGSSPARHPDPAALERFAKVDLPKQILAKDASDAILSDGKSRTVLLGSRVGTAKGFPAITLDFRKSVDGHVNLLTVVSIFAGPSVVTVKSESAERRLVDKNLQLMLDNITLVEGAPIS